jgi:hypothetical protein
VALPTRPEVRLPTRKPLEWAAHLANAKKAIKAWHARVTSVSAPHWEDAADLMTENFGELKWRIRGLLIDKSLVVVAADPKASKTWLLLELAIAQATATKAFDTHEAAEGASMMFLTEDSRRSLRNRIRGLMQTRGLSSTDADLAASKIKLRVRQQLDLCNWNDVAGLVASVYASPVRPAMICLDPLRNLHDKDEDKSGEMREVMAALRCIRDLCNCAVVFAHHNSKPSSNGDKRAAAHRMRGSSAIHGAVDGLINMVNTEIGPNTITNDVVVVLKDARGAGSFQLELRIDDDDGGEAKRAQWFVREIETCRQGCQAGAQGHDPAAGARRRDEDHRPWPPATGDARRPGRPPSRSRSAPYSRPFAASSTRACAPTPSSRSSTRWSTAASWPSSPAAAATNSSSFPARCSR